MPGDPLAPLRARYLAAGFPPRLFAERPLRKYLESRPGTVLEEVYPTTAEQRLFLGPWRMIQQVAATLEGPLDRDAFEAAWRLLFQRHPGLRTSFLPATRLALVHAEVPLELREEDWRGLPEAGQQQRLREVLAADRRRGYGRSETPPLTRFVLIRCSDTLHRLVWSYDHVLLDGWSRTVAWRELAIAYEALKAGQTPVLPEPPPRFVEYVRLRQHTPMSSAEEAQWRQRLARFPSTTLLGEAAREAPLPAPSRAAGGAPDGEALRRWAQRHGLRLTTLLYGAWALVLSHAAGERDVAFFYHCSDRPPELQAVERTLGVFYTRSFVRARVRPEAEVLRWLAELEEETAAVARSIFKLSPAALWRWSGKDPLRRMLLPRVHVADYSDESFHAPWQSLDTDLGVLGDLSEEQLRNRRGSRRAFIEISAVLGGGLPLRARPLFESLADMLGVAWHRLTRASAGSRLPRRTMVTDRFQHGGVALYLVYHPGIFGRGLIEPLAQNFAAVLEALVSGEASTLGAVLERLSSGSAPLTPPSSPRDAASPARPAPGSDPSARGG